MATVKILYTHTGQYLENYLKNHELQERDSGKQMPPLTEHNCFLDGMAEEFQQVQSQFQSEGNNAIHLIQSWHPKESKTLTPEQIHKMGIEMANRFAPGHQFVIQTHTDHEHHHNHIIINPVHMETGQRIQNKYENLYKLRDINDQIAREHGLSVLPPQEKLRRSGPGEKARRIEAYRGRSYIVDLANKADFARGHATNYDEYLSILGGFNIQARIEDKNITYFYPGRDVGKRGKNLSPDLDKPGLERKFAQNLEKLQKSPELQQTLTALSGKSFSPATNVPGPLVSKRKEGITHPRADAIQNSFIPIEEIQQAKTQSILKYCEKEKIKLTITPDGKTVLKNREHVEIETYSWINHKNKTRGTLIDFVANHRSTSLLHAVSIINDNPNLMLLERHVGSLQRSYQSFQVPKGDSASREEAIQHLSAFLGPSFRTDNFASLLRSQAAQVTRDGAIRFFPERDHTGYLEYLPQSDGTYRSNVRGDVRTPFFYQRGKHQDLSIYLDPKTLIQHRPEAFQGASARPHGTLGLLEPNLALAHQVIATQKQLKSVQIICDPFQMESPEIKSFYDELKQSLDPFSIDTFLVPYNGVTPSFHSDQSRGLEPTLEL